MPETEILPRVFADVAASGTQGPGVAAALLHGGKVRERFCCGHANLNFAVAITGATRFPLISVSKTFAAALVSLLVAENRIAWDDDIRTYLADLPDGWFEDTPITVRHSQVAPW